MDRKIYRDPHVQQLIAISPSRFWLILFIISDSYVLITRMPNNR